MLAGAVLPGGASPLPHAGTPAACSTPPAPPTAQDRGYSVGPIYRPRHRRRDGRTRCAANANVQELTGKPAQPSSGKAAAQKG